MQSEILEVRITKLKDLRRYIIRRMTKKRKEKRIKI